MYRAGSPHSWSAVTAAAVDSALTPLSRTRARFVGSVPDAAASLPGAHQFPWPQLPDWKAFQVVAVHDYSKISLLSRSATDG